MEDLVLLLKQYGEPIAVTAICSATIGFGLAYSWFKVLAVRVKSDDVLIKRLKSELSEVEEQKTGLMRQVDEYEQKTNNKNKLSDLEPSNLDFAENMTEALRYGMEPGTTRVRVYSYVGNYFKSWFRDLDPDLVDGVKIQTLFRNPDTIWTLPANQSKQAKIRRDEILSTISFFETHHALGKMEHRRLQQPRKEWARYYDHEPTHRVVLIERNSGSALMCFSLYDVQERAEFIPDFTGTGLPVVCVKRNPGEKCKLMDGFSRWFDLVWATAVIPDSELDQ